VKVRVAFLSPLRVKRLLGFSRISKVAFVSVVRRVKVVVVASGAVMASRERISRLQFGSHRSKKRALLLVTNGLSPAPFVKRMANKSTLALLKLATASIVVNAGSVQS